MNIKLIWLDYRSSRKIGEAELHIEI
jgi:hypothetical protein